METDRTYFMRRAAQERSAATHSEGKAREAHQKMAERYRDLVRCGDPAAPAETAAQSRVSPGS
jgi:hypothetical protein